MGFLETYCAINRTYGARENGDGTYRLVQIIKSDEVEKLAQRNKEASEEYARIAKHFAECEQKEYAEDDLRQSQYYKEKYEDLIDNKGKHYIIK